MKSLPHILCVATSKVYYAIIVMYRAYFSVVYGVNISFNNFSGSTPGRKLFCASSPTARKKTSETSEKLRIRLLLLRILKIRLLQ